MINNEQEKLHNDHFTESNNVYSTGRALPIGQVEVTEE